MRAPFPIPKDLVLLAVLLMPSGLISECRGQSPQVSRDVQRAIENDSRLRQRELQQAHPRASSLPNLPGSRTEVTLRDFRKTHRGRNALTTTDTVSGFAWGAGTLTGGVAAVIPIAMTCFTAFIDEVFLVGRQ